MTLNITKKIRLITGFAAAFAVASCGYAGKQRLFDADRAIETMRHLSTDEMQGRRTGGDSIKVARSYLIAEFERLGITPVFPGYSQSFDFTTELRSGAKFSAKGVNLVAKVSGKRAKKGRSNPAIVISAHYDHEGVKGGEIYNGADDNASGVAALLALAESYQSRRPRHDTFFVLFDAEELGLVGARHFVSQLGELTDNCVALNLNMDMVSRNDKNQLYVAGAHHTPQLKPIIQTVAKTAPVDLLMGHDRPEDGPQDWTLQSDHGPFKEAGIPFVYFGVEDHAHYHKPTDDFDTVPLDFFVRAIETIEMTARRLDAANDTFAASCPG